MRWFWRILKLGLVVGFLLAFGKLAVPWIAEQAYLSRSRAAPVLPAARLTPQNAAQIAVLEKLSADEILPAGYQLLDVVWKSSERALLLVSRNDTLILSDFPQIKQLQTWLASPRVAGATWGAAQFSQDMRFVAAKYANQVKVYIVESGQPLSPWIASSELFTLSPDGTRLAQAGTLGLSDDPSRVAVHKTSDGSQAALFKTRAFYWRDLTFSPDGALLVVLGDERQPSSAWMGRTPVFTWLNTIGNQVAISGDGSVVATSSAIIFLKTRQVIPLQYPPPSQTPWDVAFSPDGSLLVTQTVEGGLYFWRVSDGALLTSRGIPPGQAEIVFSPDGAMFSVLVDNYIVNWGLP